MLFKLLTTSIPEALKSKAHSLNAAKLRFLKNLAHYKDKSYSAASPSSSSPS